VAIHRFGQQVVQGVLMAQPLPTVSVQGTGVVPADLLNTYVQVIQNFAQLRTFTALNDMCVSVLGGASEGDGLQGLFWYSAASTAVDNGSTVIEPTGASGAWLLLPPGSNSPGNFANLAVSGNGTFGGNASIGGTLAVTGAATFATDLLMTGTGEIEIPAGTTGQRSASPVAGMIRYNTSLSQFEGYGALWSPLAGTGVAFLPSGRLTLTSGVPVLSATVTAASGLTYTPYVGAIVPQWNGSAWSSTVFAEISQPLNDTTNSPAAAVAGGLYDLFVWFKAGVATLSRGPAWTNPTTRALSLNRVQGFLVNSLPITNGPAAGYGFYVGTIACDAGAATVTFNPTPAAASGGPTNGAWVGLWNAFNRVSVTATAQDNKSTWTYSGGAWRQSDNSANNRITNVVGQVQDSISVEFVQGQTGYQATHSMVGIGVNSTSTPSGVVGITPNTSNSGVSSEGSPTARFDGLPSLGLSFYQALEWSNSTNSPFYGGSTPSGGSGQGHQLAAQFTY
jgi:hypothetical protein